MRERPLRALIVMPEAEPRGGSEHQLQQLIAHRHHANLELTVAFLRPGPMIDLARAEGVRAEFIDAGRLRQPGRFAAAVRSLVRLAHAEHAEVVIGWLAKGQVYGGAAARVARLPSVWLQPGLPAGRAPVDRVGTLLPARLVITVSATVEAAQRSLWPRRPTTIVYPAVDTARFDARRVGTPADARRRLGLPSAGIVFGSVGRLERWKGFATLLAAAPAVLERDPGSTLVLVGGPHVHDPGHARELQAQAERLGYNGRVRLVGAQANPEDWMQAMDVFALTSDNEPFGMVVIEAMALGKPVVATDAGGPAEVITHGVDGLLTRYGDRAALAGAILRYLGDDGLRRSVAAAAQRRAQDFTVEGFAIAFGAAVADAVR